jgi:hypothetical protein
MQPSFAFIAGEGFFVLADLVGTGENTFLGVAPSPIGKVMKPRPTSPSAAVVPEATLSPPWQIGLSLVLAIHLAAVIAAPLMFATRGSAAVRPLFAVLQPYIDLLYLNHGYFFFAPDPGPNHLVRYELEFKDGRRPIVGEFPDLQTEWPRLMYHRHFMLSETLNRFYRPPQPERQPREPGESASRQERRSYNRAKQDWDREYAQYKNDRETYEALRASIGGHLEHEYGADDVTLIRRRHRLLDPEEILEDRLQLRDEATYITLPEVSPSAEALPWTPAPSR